MRDLLFMPAAALLLGGGALVGCESEPEAQLPLDEDTCGLSTLMPYMGQPMGEVPQAVLDALSKYRTLAPGQVATQDYRLDRLTISTDENGHISALQCG